MNFERQIIVNGGKTLNGEVEISGAKNSIVELIPAAILTKEKVVLKNVPAISDVVNFTKILASIGVKTRYNITDGILEIQADEIVNNNPNFKIMAKLKASYYLLGALLGRNGSVVMGGSGGCEIGVRAIDLHLRAMIAMGAQVKYQGDINRPTMLEAFVEDERMKGGDVDLLITKNGVDENAGVKITSHGATVNALLASVLADGQSVINNASLEPEVDDLIFMLQKMGADIKREVRDDNNVIVVNGVEKLSGCEYDCLPDRMEAATFMSLAVATKSDIVLKNVNTEHMTVVLNKFEEAGVEFEIKKVKPFFNTVSVYGSKIDKLNDVEIKCYSYPDGFPTDAQSPFMTMMGLSQGTKATVHEMIYENRLIFLNQLEKLGVKVEYISNRVANVVGIKELNSNYEEISCVDLRSGASNVIAALAKNGTTCINEIFHIERGYANFISRLRCLGADIKEEIVSIPFSSITPNHLTK